MLPVGGSPRRYEHRLALIPCRRTIRQIKTLLGAAPGRILDPAVRSIAGIGGAEASPSKHRASGAAQVSGDPDRPVAINR